MSLLVVGSIALDSVYTPFGETADAPGGSAVFFSAAGAILHPVQIVGVVGTDYPLGALKTLEARGVDLAGVEQAPGESFRWKAKYSYDLASRETLETRLGVFADFRPKLPPKFRDARYLFLGNIDPELQLGVLDQVKDPALVACDTMNYWIHSKRDLLLELLRHIDILMVNDSEARELSGDWNIYRAARWVLERGPKMTVIKQGEHGLPAPGRVRSHGRGRRLRGWLHGLPRRERRCHCAEPAARHGLRRRDGLVRGGGLRRARARARDPRGRACPGARVQGPGAL